MRTFAPRPATARGFWVKTLKISKMELLKKAIEKLQRTEERLSLIKFSNEIEELQEIEKKFDSIKRNN